MSIQCRNCQRPIGPGDWRCPHCGMPLPAGGKARTWRFWRDTPLARRMIPIIAAFAITWYVMSLAYDDVTNYIAVRAKARTDAADSRELLLREQQRLNQPDGSENLAAPLPNKTTALPPARTPKAMMAGIATIMREVGDRSRYRQAQVEQRIDGLHLENQLLPETLLGAQGTLAGRLANRQYVELLNYSQSIKRASQIDAARRLGALVGEGPDGRAILIEFGRNLARESEEDAALMANRRATIDKIEKVYDLADAQRQHIDLSDDGSLVFADPKLGEQYNRLIGDIDLLIQQRQRIDIQRQARTKAALDEIEKIRP
ncbi:hypothetical protein J5226_07045 [Lysobacter sp. K5869]|uniref:hypothetical protein n=1 Tax=Lysobacter sp. K5869 TaxID=2820808 RepID=UPI001C062C57|nr:hypothetical protein [Lysobacter sp. K5869]QWP78146.1 hypothetical protein J5226_07045 [Lysobacter sp. K5869]